MKHLQRLQILVYFIFAALCWSSSAQNIRTGNIQYSRSALLIADRGMQIQEPKPLKKVESIYPEAARKQGTHGEVIIEILINERGHVDDATIRSGDPSLRDAALTAVKQWVFAPTLLDGRSVQVKATVVFMFNLYGTPRSLDMQRTGVGLYVHTGPESERLFLDQSGVLTGRGGATFAPTEIHDTQQRFRPATLRFDISTSYTIPFAVLDNTLRSLEEAGIWVFRLESPEYRFRDASYPFVISSTEPHLFYSALLNGQSNLIQLVGADPTVAPPKFDFDFKRLGELITVAVSAPRIFFFTVFVDERGTILAVENADLETKEAGNALKQARVLVPGRRENINVPTAVLVAIPKK